MTMNTLWYNAPAADWNSALPVGNGRLGAMVYGRTGHEIIQLNEESVWSSPYTDRNNRSCAGQLKEIRSLLAAGKAQEAQELAFEAMTGTHTQQAAYQTAGELHIDFCTAEKRGVQGPLPERTAVFENLSLYRRELDVETAIASTSFLSESSIPSTAIFSKNTTGSSVTYTREVFASAPADVLVIHIAASIPKSISFCAYFERGIFVSRQYALTEDTIVMEDTHGIPFSAMATAVLSGGKVCVRGGRLIVEAADEVTLYVDIESAFRKGHYFRSGGHAQNRKRLAAWCTDKALQKLCMAFSRPYGDVRADHIAEYSARYRKISLSLTESEEDKQLTIPTDELLKNHADSPALAELYWNYCRYLLLSCSRTPGTLPATLQGLWNKDIDPPWGSRYTININLEMNYWPASMCAMADTELPLFRLLSRIYKRGKKTARIMYNCDGYVAHHNVDIWADTAPQDSWLPGSYWLLGAAWLAIHIREHYEYTLDKKFLRKHFYLLKEACEFFMSCLVPSADGKHLVLCPTVSPENTYRLPSGETASLAMGADMDNRILEELFSATVKSATDLFLSHSVTDSLRYKDVLSKLEAPAITEDGCIREWPFACEEAEPGHRHISHLYGLFPGHSIHPVRTPDLAAAARRSIEKRLANGGGHTGWSLAWIFNCWVSLHEGEEAFRSLVELFRRSTQPNLLDSHPPFQIDGNFGSLAAMTRMVVSSEMREGRVDIELLPALPSEWKQGTLSGVRIKGNMRMDISWKDGKLASARIYTAPGSVFCRNIAVNYQGKRYEAELADGSLDVLNVLPSTV